MHLESFVHLQYCYNYLINQIPVGLLLYSHIPTGLIAILFSGYVLFKTRSLSSLTLFVVCFAFAAWSLFDLGSWFAFLGASNMMFMWSLLDFIALIFFAFSYYFLYTFITGNDLPLWQKLLGLALVLPTAIATLLGINLIAYNATTCEALEYGQFITMYPYYAEAAILLACIALGIWQYRKHERFRSRQEILLSCIGVVLFLGFFFSSTLGVSLLVDYDIGQYAYNYEIYGLFGMPVLLIYLGYLIVRYKAFDLRIFGAQGLVFALIAILASEYAFVTSISNKILVSLTLVLTGMIGIVLIRSVRREIAQREHIEVLAKDLEVANKQQVALIHFITHQLKGFVAKSRNIFAMIQEGDYGPVPPTMKPMIDEGFNSATKGAQTIQEILNASNIKTGKVTYDMKPFDFKELIDGIIANLKPNAEAKNVALTIDEPAEPVMLTGDRTQLENAIKNLVDNSIKYTPQGSIKAKLTSDGKTVRFMTEDTGVGITPEDMKHLFTEGGHGAESTKVNVDSTGFGLYIVKNIIEAHGGKVWAESEGAGKGSRFIIELPATMPA